MTAVVSNRSAAGWLRELQHTASQQHSLRGLNRLVEVIGVAAGCTGAVLWEETDRPAGSPALAVLAQWPRGGARRCDATTLSAFRTGTLALPAESTPAQLAAANGNGGPPVGTNQVIGALPVELADGSRGVLSLTGPARLSEAAFDIAADLLDVLPELRDVLHDRQALHLVRECQRVLHEVDLASPHEPLPPERLAEHLAGLCRSVAGVLECAEVSLYLREYPGQEQVPLLASTSRQRTGFVQLGRPTRGRTLDVPLFSGDRAWGLIRCAGAYEPPLWFTRTDEDSLAPVADQLARYWSTWLHRRAISAENLSWQRLAEGITRFNQLISQELARGTPHDEVIDEIALKTVLDVVPECGRVDIWQRPRRGSALVHRASRTAHGELDEAGAALPPPVAELLARVYRRATPVATTDATLLNPAGTRQGYGFLVGIPIGFGGRCEGVLAAFGPADTLPTNSTQVCEIIGDQLALYQQLHQTMANLQQTRRRLQETVRSQADTLADLEHQMVSPLLTATSRIDRVILGGRFDSRTDAQLRACRGLCRKASRVAMSAGVFAGLSKDRPPTPKDDLLGADDVLRLLIACADDAQMLSNPRRRIAFDVRRDSVRALGRRLVRGDRSFLEQCIGNVLDNAAKYSYVDTAVDIGGGVEAGEFSIVVTSHGLPLDPKDVQNCLVRNWRGPEASATTGEGSGLGLWIVDNLMRSMRGSVRVSAAGDETTVRLNLPVG
jgi:signal transduction histidine kinase